MKIGNLDISKIYLGSTEVTSIYLGADQVYEEETPPTFQGKWLATYTGGTTSSADCDSSSAITNGEITLTDLETVEIGNCVTEIGSSAFTSCSTLSNITIGNSVTSIGAWAFMSCHGLTSITINAITPPTLGGLALVNTNNCPIYVPSESVDTYKAATNWSTLASRIQAIPFQGKWLATYTGGTTSSAECDSSSAITSNEITLTDLETVEIGDCVTSIGDYAFYQCSSLTSVDIPDSVTSIGNQAFRLCSSLSSVTIGNSVTSIGESAFYNCSSLTSCTIGSGVTSIGESTFAYCSGITSIDIPSAVTSIGTYAFGGCRSLTSVTVNATTPPTLSNANAFVNTNNCPIYVPSASVNAYKAAANWSTLASRIQAIPSQ